MRNLVLTLSLVMVLLTAFGGVSAQDSAWDVTCPAPSGDYTRGGIFPRFEYRNRRLILVDIQTREVVQELETSFESPEFHLMSWSPDCRYLVGAIGYDNGDGYTAVVWDVTAPARIAEFPHSYGGWRLVHWSPDSQYVIVDTAVNAHLVDTATRTIRFLADAPRSSNMQDNNAFNFVRWDESRQQVIASLENGDIAAYDLNTGAVAAYFHNPDTYGCPEFVLSPDNTRIAVFSACNGEYFAVWNRDATGELQLDTDKIAPTFVTQVAFSPSNHYVVIGSVYSIRIWDLSNLSADIDVQARDPIYVYPTYLYPQIGTRRLRFVDDNIIENTDAEGNTLRWNIHTGEIITSS